MTQRPASHVTRQVSAVVPVFNSASSLPSLVHRLQETLRTVSESFEVILVDDGSSDDGWAIIRDLADRCQTVRGISLSRNFGQHNALLEGIRSAQYPVVVTIDDDLQHPPEEIPALLSKLDEGYDVVYGTPEKSRHSRRRGLASWLMRASLRLVLGLEVARHASAFRAIRTRMRDAFEGFSGPYVSLDVLLSWGTTRYAAVPVRHDPTHVGRSRYRFRSLVAVALNMLTGFSVLPLRLASVVGLVFSLMGVAVLVFVLVRVALAGGSVPGFPFLASVVAIFSGVQLFVIGVIGEYLARVHFQVMGRPSAVVRERVGFEARP